MMKSSTLVIIISIICSNVAFSQNLQVGVYAEEILYSEVIYGQPAPGCYGHIHNYGMDDIQVVGMQVYLSIDSVRGESGFVEIKRWPLFQTEVVSDGDQIQLNQSGILDNTYFFFSGIDTVYASIVRKGIPMLDNQEYHTVLYSYQFESAPPCEYVENIIYTLSDSAFVSPGFVESIDGQCDQAAILATGMNWFSTQTATAFTGNMPECWSENPMDAELLASWYTFTTPAYPVTIELALYNLWWETSMEFSGVQIGLYNSCSADPIYCAGSDELIQSNAVLDCSALLPNTQYFLLVANHPDDSGIGEQGAAMIVMNISDICENAGCIDPNACNYNPFAQYDDGSCSYAQGCNEVYSIAVADTMSCNSFLLEVPFPTMWGYWSYNGSVLPEWADLSYFSTEEPGTHSICFHSFDPATGYAVACVEFYVPQSCFEGCYASHSIEPTTDPCQYILSAETSLPLDSGSVNWIFSNGDLIISDTVTYVTFPSDGEYLFMLSINSLLCQTVSILDTVLVSGCSGELIFGCMDPTALNYNPLANASDGSCIYSSSCDIALIAVPDSTNISNLIIYSNLDLNTATYVFWDFGDGNTSEEAYPQHTYTGEGPYLLCVSVSIEIANVVCESEACILIDESMVEGSGFVSSGFTIGVQYQGAITAVAKSENYENVVWPNPVNDILNYRFDNSILSLRILDLMGREIKNVAFAQPEGAIDVQTMSQGVYLLEIRSEFGIHSTRFIKQ